MHAATYLRSSKDRSDISIEAQRQKLAELAATKSLALVAEFADVVESGKDEDRDGLQQLIEAIKNRRRGWTWLLILDTSRLARNRFSAQWIKRDCKKYGVEILFANMADLDPITKVLVESVFEGVDEWHSQISKQKAIAGMRVNVSKGWRAGGRAPTGYRLQHESTGAIRDGRPVMKSKLVPNDDAPKMKAYLTKRAQGSPRVKLLRELALPWKATTLVDIEWNALVYAGHTVWNRHTDKSLRGHGSPRRRDRSEWQIERDTHPALITDAEAETILAQLQTSDRSRSTSRAMSAVGTYLLSGMLETGDGRKWTGAGDHYRLKATPEAPGKKVDRELIERAILTRITADMRSDEFIDALVKMAKSSGLGTDPAAPLRAEQARLKRERDRAAKLALTTDDSGTFTRLVEERGRQIAAAEREIQAIEADASLTRFIQELTPIKMRELMMEVGSPTAVLHTFVERIVLEPDLSSEIRYRAWSIPVSRNGVPTGIRHLDTWTLGVALAIVA